MGVKSHIDEEKKNYFGVHKKGCDSHASSARLLASTKLSSSAKRRSASIKASSSAMSAGKERTGALVLEGKCLGI